MHKYLPSNKALKSHSQSLRREMTPEEKHLWYDFLKNYEIQFYRQKVIGNYIVDFYCRRAKLAVEIDGAQHYENDAIEYDLRRTEYLNSEGIAVLRFLNGDTVLLRFPKISAASRLEIFDRGAKPCSLFRPLDALRKPCPKGEGKRTNSPRPYGRRLCEAARRRAPLSAF